MKNIVQRIVIIVVRLLWSVGAIILWIPANTVYFIITGKDEWSWWNNFVLLEKYGNLIDRFDDWINNTKE